MPARSAHKEIVAQIEALRTLEPGSPAQRDLATTYLRKARNLEVVQATIGVIAAYEDPVFHDLLVEKFEWCEQAPDKQDSGGIVRAAILRALQPIQTSDDIPLLQRALNAYQVVGLYEICAELRTAALNALNDLDPDLAALYAARFLTDPRNSNAGEPAISAIRLLAAQQHLGPVFALASWDATQSFSGGNAEVIGEALRNLTDLPASLVPLLIEHHRESENEQILLGLYDLLLVHPNRREWHNEIILFLRTTPLIDLYGLIAMQIVASRDEALITALRNLAEVERDRTRLQLLRQALEHA